MSLSVSFNCGQFVNKKLTGHLAGTCVSLLYYNGASGEVASMKLACKFYKADGLADRRLGL